eukprot:1531464-Lingulodinium_polyedra.AAC.1
MRRIPATPSLLSRLAVLPGLPHFAFPAALAQHALPGHVPRQGGRLGHPRLRPRCAPGLARAHYFALAAIQDCGTAIGFAPAAFQKVSDVPGFAPAAFRDTL